MVILALVMLLWERNMTSPSPPGLFPVRSFDVRMAKSARGEFVAQMRAFGEAFRFKVVTTETSRGPDDIFFAMLRSDIELVAANDSDTGATDLKFGIDFYPKRDQSAPSPEKVAPLVEGLRQFLAQVPGAAITEVTARR